MRDDDDLVRIHAASVNALDTKIKRGEFKLILPTAFPLFRGTTWPARSFGWVFAFAA